MLINANNPSGLGQLGATPQQWLNLCVRNKTRRACDTAIARGMTIPADVRAQVYGNAAPATAPTPPAPANTPASTPAPAPIAPPAPMPDPAAAAAAASNQQVVDQVRKNNAKYREVNQGLRTRIAELEAAKAAIETAPVQTADQAARVAELEAQIATVKKNNAKYREVNQGLRRDLSTAQTAARLPDPAAAAALAPLFAPSEPSTAQPSAAPAANAIAAPDEAAGKKTKSTLIVAGIGAIAVVGALLLFGGGKR